MREGEFGVGNPDTHLMVAEKSATIFYGDVMLEIGIIGYGFVGKATHMAFEHNSIATIVDPRCSLKKIQDFGDNISVVFICLPAPTTDMGHVDFSLIHNALSELEAMEFPGIVVLKSTLPPNVVNSFTKFKLRYVYSPEFLREAHWLEDALNPPMIVLAGQYEDTTELTKIYTRHSHIKDDVQFFYKDYKEAALVKYAINTFLATKLVYMNQLNQLYSDLYYNEVVDDTTWQEFIDMIATDKRIGDTHMTVPGPDGLRGYGGSCFPKDVKAMCKFDINGRMSVLHEASIANTKIRLS
jgi:nucleotide sugar dehydrogenase